MSVAVTVAPATRPVAQDAIRVMVVDDAVVVRGLIARSSVAVEVEDHPLEYGGFEGVIPKGEYGAGTVMIWDRGTWMPEIEPDFGLRKGHLKFRLSGEKLTGLWHLVRMAPKSREKQEAWLLFKSDDAEARSAEAPDILEEMPLSAASSRTMDEIARDQDRVWSSKQGEITPKPAEWWLRPVMRAARVGEHRAVEWKLV